MSTVEQILTIIGGVLVCGGFWTFIQFLISRNDGKKKAMETLQNTVNTLQAGMTENNKNMKLQNEALMSLAQDRIIFLGKYFLEQGWISVDELANLRRMADAYRALGGNALVKEIMDEVDQLPHKKEKKK